MCLHVGSRGASSSSGSHNRDYRPSRSFRKDGVRTVHYPLNEIGNTDGRSANTQREKKRTRSHQNVPSVRKTSLSSGFVKGPPLSPSRGHGVSILCTHDAVVRILRCWGAHWFRRLGHTGRVYFLRSHVSLFLADSGGGGKKKRAVPAYGSGRRRRLLPVSFGAVRRAVAMGPRLPHGLVSRSVVSHPLPPFCRDRRARSRYWMHEIEKVDETALSVGDLVLLLT